ncbi:MAG: S1 family peptidase [Cytophagales bacterium]|nr:S1 family peptidase [Cytophagales bacterium]
MISKLTILLSSLILFILTQACGIYMQDCQLKLENSVFAIVKISYNKVGETPVEGGICGTAFLINDSTAITANHVLNNTNYLPNPGFKHVQFWLVKRGTKKIIELKKEDLKPLQNIETTLIKLYEKIKCDFKVTEQVIKINDLVFNYGHIINMPITKAHWGSKLIIDDYSLKSSKSDKKGQILSVKKVTVNSNDLRITDKTFIQPSFIANVGMSGGPLISQNKLIGLMSFGLPADSMVKTEVYAISINEIIKEIKK